MLGTMLPATTDPFLPLQEALKGHYWKAGEVQDILNTGSRS